MFKGDYFSHLRYRWLTVVLFLQIVLVSCGADRTSPCPNSGIECDSPSPTPRSTAIATDWSVDWVKGVPCRAPCFNGITPGMTGATDVLTKLQNVPYIANIKDDVHSAGNGTISWDWKGSLNQDNGGYIEYFHRNNQSIVMLTTLIFPTSVSLGSVIQTYGQPSDLIVKADYDADGRKYYYIGIIFRTVGIYLWADTYLPTNPFPEISPELPLIRAEFFEPTEDGFNTMLQITGLDKQYAEYHVAWQGYGELSTYCTHTACRAVQPKK